MEGQTVRVWLHRTGEPIVHENVTNTYIKGWFYCIYQRAKQRVLKYPERNIWRVEEEYLDVDRKNIPTPIVTGGGCRVSG